MTDTSRRRLMKTGLFGAICACAAPSLAFAAAPGGKFVCPPCGCAAHDDQTGKDKEFDAAGECPSCGMTLIPKPAAEPAPAPKPQASFSR